MAWEGEKQTYHLTGGEGGERRGLVLGVAAGSRCPSLGHLHAGSVWNGAVRLAQLIESGFLCKWFAGKRVLELGAGAALPSLVLLASQTSAPSALVISDYDDPALLAAIRDNVSTNSPLLRSEVCRVVGHTWGSNPSPLLSALAELVGEGAADGFDAVLLAEGLWDVSQHACLVNSICAVLAEGGEAWLCHCHHWEGHEAADRNFFRLARGGGLVVAPYEWEAAEMPNLFGEGTQRALLHQLSWSCPARKVQLNSLPNEVLETICAHLLTADAQLPWHGARSLARFLACSSRLRHLKSSPLLLPSLLCLPAAPSHAFTIEHLAMRLGVGALLQRGGGLVGFKFARVDLDDEEGFQSGVCGSRSILKAWASLLVRHDKARVRIDAHCGPSAPRQLALSYSLRRGLSVAAELSRRGVVMGRVEIAAWGSAVARRAALSDHLHGAQARLGVRQPTRAI